MNRFRKLLNAYTTSTEPIHYLLSAGVIAVKLGTNVPRTIEYIMDDITHDTIGDTIGTNVKLDKALDLKFQKDEEFVDDTMANSMMIWSRFLPETSIETVRNTCESVSNDCFGISVDMVVCEGTSHQHMIECSRKTQTQVMGTNPCIFYIFPKEGKVLCYADHYYADGKFVFEFTSGFICLFLGREVKYARFASYAYIPVVSDAKMMKRWGELIESHVRYPIQNTMATTTRIQKVSMDPHLDTRLKSMRWTNYARALYPLFQVSDRDYFQVAITVGLDIPHRFYTNNRVGSIAFTLHRPDRSASYKDSILEMASAISRDVTANRLDAFLSYDVMSSFDTHLIRKLGFRFRTAADVVLSPFHYVMDGDEPITDQSREYIRDTWGCFGGAMDFPYIYVSASSVDNMLEVVYQSNVPDIHLERLEKAVGDAVEFTM